MNDRSLAYSLLTSLVLHGLAIVLIGAFIHHSVSGKPDFFSVQLLDVQSLSEIVEPPREKKSQTIAKQENIKESAPALKNEIAKIEPPAAAIVKDESAKPLEAKLNAPAKTETPPVLASARVEGGGSELGTSALFGRSDVGLTPGAGSGGGGGGAVAGLGRGSGAPGLAAQPAIFRTNREARPIQTARAAYPAMALRAGLESDVALRIEVDPQGNVIKAEVIKSGGAGFDDEALKAVKQSRFEPAQRDGENVPAEFTYIYRFRLQR
jgi:TonB family protein